jgi:hypothetical protein
MDPVFEVLEGFLVGGTEIEKLRVGRDIERHFVQPVVTLIHGEWQ